MNLIKDIIQDHINDLDHEPEKIYDGSWRYVYPEPNWDSVEDDVLEALEAHIEVAFLETNEAYEVVQKGVKAVKESLWYEETISDARSGWHEEHERMTNPYRYYGVSKHQF